MSGNNFVCIAVEEKEERKILTSENEACVLQKLFSIIDRIFESNSMIKAISIRLQI